MGQERIPEEEISWSKQSNYYSYIWLFSLARTGKGIDKLPNWIAVTEGDLSFPTRGFPLDNEVCEQFKMDHSQRLVDINLHFSPMVEVKVLVEDNKTFEYIYIDGVRLEKVFR